MKHKVETFKLQLLLFILAISIYNYKMGKESVKSRRILQKQPNQEADKKEDTNKFEEEYMIK